MNRRQEREWQARIDTATETVLNKAINWEQNRSEPEVEELAAAVRTYLKVRCDPKQKIESASL
jgi:hypothetical protein